MKKKDMAKKKLDIFAILALFIGILVSIGVGGLFINGTFTSVILLEYLPLIVHKGVGYLIVGGTILGLVLKLLKK